jgi:heme/copper-type cytochrome/quinol oxidase subunit 3
MTNTIVLILSSVTVVLGWASLKMGKFKRYKFYQGITILCALIFLGIKSFEYHDKFIHYKITSRTGASLTAICNGRKRPCRCFVFSQSGRLPRTQSLRQN